jgi:sec-independent protein translocase protein TatC
MSDRTPADGRRRGTREIDPDEPFPRSEEEFGDPVDAFRMPLMDHLKELRKRLIIAIVATLVGMLACFGFVEQIWQFLVQPMNDALDQTGRGTMAITEPLEGFMTLLKVAGVGGVAAASPIISYQFWKFVAPGLYPKEKRLILPLVFASTFLFLTGVVFAYFVIFKYAFPFFIEVNPEGVEAVLSMQAYLSVATRLLLAFGASFQLPVVVFFLARAGLIDHIDMMRFFKYSVVGIFIVSAMLTPPDVVSQLLMAGPLLLLYGIGIIIARFVSTKDRSEEEEEDDDA